MLMLHRGDTVCHVARRSAAPAHPLVAGLTGSRSLARRSEIITVRTWETLAVRTYCALLRELVKHSPGDFGYQRSAGVPNCWR